MQRGSNWPCLLCWDSVSVHGCVCICVRAFMFINVAFSEWPSSKVSSYTQVLWSWVTGIYLKEDNFHACWSSADCNALDSFRSSWQLQDQEEGLNRLCSICGITLCVPIDFPAHCASSQGKRIKISKSIYSVNVEVWIPKNCSAFFFLNYLCSWFQGKVIPLFSSRNVWKKISCYTFFTTNFFLVIFSPWHIYLFQLCFLLKLKPLLTPARSELPCDPWKLYGMNPQWLSWHVEVTKSDMDGKVHVSLSLWSEKSCEATALPEGYLSPLAQGTMGPGGPGYLVEGHSWWCLSLVLQHYDCSAGKHLVSLGLATHVGSFRVQGWTGKLFLLWDCKHIFLTSDQVLIFLTISTSLVLSRSLTFCQQWSKSSRCSKIAGRYMDGHTHTHTQHDCISLVFLRNRWKLYNLMVGWEFCEW